MVKMLHTHEQSNRSIHAPAHRYIQTFQKKRKKNLLYSNSDQIFWVQIRYRKEWYFIHYESLLEIPEMLLQNLSNTFSSWCSNKSFKMHFISSGHVVEWRALRATRNLFFSAPKRSPEEKKRWSHQRRDYNWKDRKRVQGWREWTEEQKWERERRVNSIITWSHLPSLPLHCQSSRL